MTRGRISWPLVLRRRGRWARLSTVHELRDSVVVAFLCRFKVFASHVHIASHRVREQVNNLEFRFFCT